MADNDATELAASLTMAWLANPQTRVAADDVPAFLAAMHKAVTDLTAPAIPAVEEAPTHTPAVSIRKSLADLNFIVSLIDGRAYKTLKRHLSRHGLTPEAYRERFGLKADYPITAPAYSAARTAMAKALGLGRKAGERPSSKQAVETPQKVARGSKAKSGSMTATQT